MDEFPWYDDAALIGGDHIFCVGSLAQCLRKWKRLPEQVQSDVFLKLHKPFNGRVKLDHAEIAGLVERINVMKV